MIEIYVVDVLPHTGHTYKLCFGATNVVISKAYVRRTKCPEKVIIAEHVALMYNLLRYKI